MSHFLASLRLDLEHAKRGFRRWATYRAATAAGLFVNTVFGFIRVFILLQLFQGRSEVAGYDRAATIAYAWLTQGLIATIYIWGWQELAVRIRTGDIATDLIRPVHPLRAGVAFDLGRAAYHALFRGVPPIVVGALVFGFGPPADPIVLAAFGVSVALAVVVSYWFRVLYNLASFWLLDHRGTAMIAITVANLFSGFILPIRFFPPWLEAIANATPFPSMVQLPVDVFVGRASGAEMGLVLGTQLGWAVALMAVCYGVFALGVRKLVAQGG